jgi:PAS domain S-box-containing protein
MTQVITQPAAWQTLDLSLFEATPGLRTVFLPDSPRFTMIAVSQDMCRFVGMPREHFIGKGVFDAFPANPADTENTGHKNLLASLNEVVRTGAPHQMARQRYDVAVGSGGFREIYWQNNSVPLLDAQGQLCCIIHTAQDITEKVKAEKQEVDFRSLKKVHHLFMETPLVIGIVRGKDYVLELANREALQLWGKGPEIIGKPLLEGIPDAATQNIIPLFDEVVKTGKPFIGKEVPVVTNRQGREEVHYFDMVYQPYYDEGSTQPSGVFTLSYDVTELVEARKRVEENEEKYRSLFESMDQGFCVIEMIFDEKGQPVDYRFLEANPMFEELTGLKGGLGKTARELVPELEAHWFIRYGNVALTGKAIRFTEGSDAMGRWFDVYAYRAGGEGSRRVALLFTNITEQRKAQAAMQASEERFRQMVEHAPAAITLTRGADMILESVNEPMLQIIGKTDPKDVLGKTLLEVVPELAGQEVFKALQRVMETGKPYRGTEIPVKRLIGGRQEMFYVNLSFTPIIESGKTTAVLHLAIDVSAQVHARHKIEENSEALQMAIDIAELGTFVVDLGRNRAQFTSRVARWFGFRETELDMQAVFDAIHASDRERVVNEITNTRKNESFSRHDITYRVPDPLTGAERYLRSLGRTFFNKEGKAIQISGVIQDVTTQVQYQQQIEHSEALLQQRVKERMQELEGKNRELEQFAYAASHDMQEPLRKIATFSNFMLEYNNAQLDERGKGYLAKIGASVQRMKNIIDDLLQYSHQTREDRQFLPTDLSEVIAEIESDLDLVIEQKGAVIEKEPLPTVVAVHNQLHQLFYNLITNALKFSKPGLPPYIYIGCEERYGADLPQIPNLDSEKLYVLITVKDDGIGFEQEYAAQIFTLFKRLHGRSEYEGTGIGLALCKKIAENHGGAIWAEGRQGEGATFHVVLPVA